MDFLFSGLFWGIILILLGISIIIRIVFHVHVPLFRIIVALILIYFGIKVLVGGSWMCWHHHGALSGSSHISHASGNNEYKVVFGTMTIDAAGDVAENSPERTSVKTVFGESKIIISSLVPTIIHIRAAFSGARFPDGNTLSFGETIYKNASLKPGVSPKREIDVNVVFGSVRIVEK
jgi:hypothetical protein